jgi:hypothetical protein
MHENQEVGVIRFPLSLRIAARLVQLAETISAGDSGRSFSPCLTVIKIGASGAIGAPLDFFSEFSGWVRSISEKVGQILVPPSSPPRSYRRRTGFAVTPAAASTIFSEFFFK